MSTYPIRLVALLLCVAAAAPALAEPPVTGVRWQLDLDEARAIAEKEKKLLLVHFTAPWCAPCAALDATVYNQPAVAQVVHTSYIPVKLNTDEFPATCERFGIVQMPTDVVITPEGQVLDKFTPPRTPMAYVSKVGQLAQGYAHQKQREFQRSPMSSPETLPIEGAYANLRLPAGQQNPLVDPRTALPNTTTLNPFAGSQMSATQAGSTTPQPGTQAPAAAVAATPPAPPTITENQYVVSMPDAAGAQGQVATTDGAQDAATEAESIKLPAGAPPLGFDGFCPVSVRLPPPHQKWEKGKVEWGAIHRGRTYLFASQELRDQFLRTPDAYAPALSGVDPVLAIDEKRAEQGLREFALEYNGQVYMFSSKETMMQFWQKCDLYSNEVRQAMSGQPTRVVR